MDAIATRLAALRWAACVATAGMACSPEAPTSRPATTPRIRFRMFIAPLPSPRPQPFPFDSRSQESETGRRSRERGPEDTQYGFFRSVLEELRGLNSAPPF